MKLTLPFLISLLFALNMALATSLLRVRPHLQLHILDIGQGDAILITTPEQHHILIDGGPGRSVLTELSAKLPQLFREIDLLVLTHPHLDHMEGLIPVLQRFQVHQILMSAPHYDSLVYEAFLKEIQDYPIHLARADQDFQLGSVTLDVLYPFESLLGQEIENINNASPVIHLTQGEHSILLTGDAEQEVEAELLSQGIPLQADILKAGHHGSRTSSTLPFLEAVNPEVILISSGEGNSFGHPHPETLEKAEDLDLQVHRTDLDGSVSFIFAPQDWLRSILAPKLRSFSSRRS